MRALSACCSLCGGRRRATLPSGVVVCRVCDTAEGLVEGVAGRGCPPNMSGAVNGYTVEQTPVTPEEQS